MSRGREFQIVATSTPRAQLWGLTSADAVQLYLKTFRPPVGANLLIRPLDDHRATELYALTQHGPRRLQPGAVR